MAKRDYILHNFWWKITSLMLAIIVWIVVHDSGAAGDIIPRSKRRFAHHTLSLMRKTTDKRPIRISPNEGELIVSSPQPEATRLQDSDTQALVDMGDLTSQKHTYTIRVFAPG